MLFKFECDIIAKTCGQLERHSIISTINYSVCLCTNNDINILAYINILLFLVIVNDVEYQCNCFMISVHVRRNSISAIVL